MNLEVKSISGDSFIIPITPNTTVADLKSQIKGIKNIDCHESSIKLIRKGKALDDNSTLLNDNGECDYVVYMINRMNVGNSNQPFTQPIDRACPNETLPNSELVDLLENNFSRQLAEFALKASNNNVEDASLILTRIPASLLERLKYDDILISIVLRDDYNEIIRLYQENKVQEASLLLDSLQPGISEKLSNRVNDLIELIEMSNRQPITEESFSEYTDDSDEDFTDEDVHDITEVDESPIVLTEDEMSVISRLSDIFGVSLEVVYQIYMMCDKNEDATIGYLTEHLGDLR